MLPDDGELLIILLAEQGDVRLDLLEQPRDHRADAVEMAGPGGAVEAVAEAAAPRRVVAGPSGYMVATSGAHRIAQPSASSIAASAASRRG